MWRKPRNDAIEPLSPPADPFQPRPAVAEPAALDTPKRRRWPLFVAPAILIVAVSGWGIWSRTRPPAPVGRTLVLADFENRTGDPVFDRSLTNLLRVDLGQSQFLNVVSERQSQATLALMKKPADSPVTPALAAEICARNNGDALIQGGVVAFGARYLVTLTASDCASGQTLAAEKAEVAGREAVIWAMDGLIAKLRARLGESPRSISRFDVPLLPEKTASLDALKVYSDAKWQFDRGHIAEAIPLAVHAAELDPNFPAAYTARRGLGPRRRRAQGLGDAGRTRARRGAGAAGRGNLRPARPLAGRPRGSDDWGKPVEDRLLATLGYGTSAIGAMTPPTTGGESDRDYLWTLARVGDGAKAERAMAAMLRDKPDDTLLHAVYAPEIRASLALRRDAGAAAVRDLAPALPYMNRDLDVQDVLGNAYLAVGDGVRAAGAFRANLAHRYWSPDSPLYPLAKLGLARALSLQGDRVGAATAYRAFFADWKDADPDIPILGAAKAEFRRLMGNGDFN